MNVCTYKSSIFLFIKYFHYISVILIRNIIIYLYNVIIKFYFLSVLRVACVRTRVYIYILIHNKKIYVLLYVHTFNSFSKSSIVDFESIFLSIKFSDAHFS